MLAVFTVQNALMGVIALVLLILEAWAFLDAVSRRPDAFVAGDKLTKPAWLIILGVAFAAHLLIWNPISLLNLAGTIAVLVYLLDVRPVLRSLTRRP